MLSSLHIENYALIKNADFGFGRSFVVITGETGAGKSIMLGALSLLLGQRADVGVLADKERKCVVEARFDVSGLGLEPMFDEADIDYDDTLILRREIIPTGKSRAFANDTPVQLAFMKQLGTRLIDIHSQHETLTLADSSFRLSLLDTLASVQDSGQALKNYRDAFDEYTRLKKELEALTSQEAQNRRDADYMQFQYDELHEANLAIGEQEELEQEQLMLTHASNITEELSVALVALDNDDAPSVISQLRDAKSHILRIRDLFADIVPLSDRIEAAYIELDDIKNEIAARADSISYQPDRLQQVDDRLALIYRLEKKHQVQTVDELIGLHDDLQRRLNGMASLEEQIKALMEQVDSAYVKMQNAADRLTSVRQGAADQLSSSLPKLLTQLGMSEARFVAKLGTSDSYTKMGHDEVAFLFNANRGGEMVEMSRVASGGEMSRLMLAIKSMLTSHTLLPTIIFDEIDTGVSGDISVAVGKIMQQMAQRMQVIAITHLPQIAARASQHLKVYKNIDKETNRTVSRIAELGSQQRVYEVAVMLSSDPPSSAAMQTATELMQG
ncbi:MAG: DNA repair protein RecN [Bacteroidales bacterium]|nr:DNA repair protein RecN [Bacteroidales bacterium]